MRTIKGILLILVLISTSCERDSFEIYYITQNVIIVVIDGARYSETWGDSSFSNIPKMKLLSETGVLFTNFFNNGPTYTASGHVSITTGYYQEINNFGLEIPEYPSIFQYWNKKNLRNLAVSKILTSKDKLSVLSDCKDSSYNGIYRPMIDCGINGTGVGSGNRHDSITLHRALNVLTFEHPRLLLISFREPDYSAHQNNWPAYIEGIKNTDGYVDKIWKLLEKDNFYKGKTAMFVTNDHGRHLDNVSDGFVSHGDTCNGCKHISLLVLGPDFKKGEIMTKQRELIDISATIAEILKFSVPTGHGSIMNELFK